MIKKHAIIAFQACIDVQFSVNALKHLCELYCHSYPQKIAAAHRKSQLSLIIYVCLDLAHLHDVQNSFYCIWFTYSESPYVKPTQRAVTFIFEKYGWKKIRSKIEDEHNGNKNLFFLKELEKYKCQNFKGSEY